MVPEKIVRMLDALELALVEVLSPQVREGRVVEGACECSEVFWRSWTWSWARVSILVGVV